MEIAAAPGREGRSVAIMEGRPLSRAARTEDFQALGEAPGDFGSIPAGLIPAHFLGLEFQLGIRPSLRLLMGACCRSGRAQGGLQIRT